MEKNKKSENVRKAFGAKVRKLRREQELSQEALAEWAGLHVNYVGSVERGERNISLENIVNLARALNCSQKDLMPD